MKILTFQASKICKLHWDVFI